MNIPKAQQQRNKESELFWVYKDTPGCWKNVFSASWKCSCGWSNYIPDFWQLWQLGWLFQIVEVKYMPVPLCQRRTRHASFLGLISYSERFDKQVFLVLETQANCWHEQLFCSVVLEPLHLPSLRCSGSSGFLQLQGTDLITLVSERPQVLFHLLPSSHLVLKSFGDTMWLQKH